MDAGAFFETAGGDRAARCLGRAIAWTGHEGPVELGKLEALSAALVGAIIWFYVDAWRDFAARWPGALITLDGERTAVERAPPPPRRLETALTKRKGGGRKLAGCGPSEVECARFRAAFAAPVPLAGRGRGPTLAGTERLRSRSRRRAATRKYPAGKIIWDERQSPQFRALGHHRSAAARAVHAVSEPEPAHRLAGHLVLAASDRGRRRQGARRADPGAGDPRHLHRRPHASRPMRRTTRRWSSGSTARAWRSPRARRATACRGSCRCWFRGCRSSR